MTPAVQPTRASDRGCNERSGAELARRLETDRRRIEQLKNLKERNRDLERQIRDIQGSRSWKLLGKISRIRARVMPRRG